MRRLAVFPSLLIASLCFSNGSIAAKKLPTNVSLEELTDSLKRATGPEVEMKAGIGGFVGKVRGVDVGWIEGEIAGKSGDTLVAEAIKIMKIICDESTFQLSAMANQTLDGVRLRRQSFSCRVFGPITQYNEAVIVEDGDRFQTFYNGGLGEQRAIIAEVVDDIVRALAATYR